MECALTSPVRTECGMFVMCCMRCCMSYVSVVNVYLDYLKFCAVCINGRMYVCCGECMLFLMGVMSPPPALCNISVRSVVKLCTLVFWL